MSELQRRKRGAPDRRSAGVPSAQRDPGLSASTLDGRFDPSPGTAWQTWYDVPYEVRTALTGAGHLPRDAFVSGAIPPALPQHEADVIEYAEAWTVGEDSWTLIEAQRPRKISGTPARPWELTVRRYRYVGEVKDRYGTVPVDADSATSSERPHPAEEQPDVLDVLPSAVRGQVIATVPEPVYEDEFLLQERLKGRPHEHRAGVIRASSRQIIAVLATRSIEVRRWGSVRDAATQLASTPWYVQALTARLGAEEVFTLAVVDDEVALDSPNPTALPPSARGSGQSG